MGKYIPSFIGLKFPFSELRCSLTAVLDKTFCLAANCNPLGDIINWPILDKSSPVLCSVLALKRKSGPPVSPGVPLIELVLKGSLLLPPPIRSLPNLKDLRSVVKSFKAIFY